MKSTNVKTTYFVKDNAVIGSLDTADLTAIYDRPYFETVDFIDGMDSETFCGERSYNAVAAVALHDAWTTIIAHRLNADAVVGKFMGCDVIDNTTNGQIVKKHLTAEDTNVKKDFDDFAKKIKELIASLR